MQKSAQTCFILCPKMNIYCLIGFYLDPLLFRFSYAYALISVVKSHLQVNTILCINVILLKTRLFDIKSKNGMAFVF